MSIKPEERLFIIGSFISGELICIYFLTLIISYFSTKFPKSEVSKDF